MDNIGIIKRAKELQGIQTDADISKLLGISPTDFILRRKRGSIWVHIIKYMYELNADMQYLFYGDDAEKRTHIFYDRLARELMKSVIKSNVEILMSSPVKISPDQFADAVLNSYDTYRQAAAQEASNE